MNGGGIQPSAQIYKRNPLQMLDNLPVELLNQKRFFPVQSRYIPEKGKWEKKPAISDWGNPNNQKFYRDIPLSEKTFAGFDISGHGLATDYICVDIDHRFNTAGEFVSDEARRWVNLFTDELCSTGTYGEYSISRSGLHFVFRPTNPAEFKDYEGKGNQLNVEGGCAIEVYYKQKSRFILFTGNLYHCSANTAISTDCDNVSLVLQQIARTAHQATLSEKTLSKYDDPPEFILDCARACLDSTSPVDVVEDGGDSAWLAVLTACKNLNIPYSIVDEWNKKDSARYDERENWRRWNSKLNPDPIEFGLGTLIGKAKALSGVNPVQHKLDWYNQHPQFPVPTFSAIDDFDSIDIPTENLLSPEMRRKLFKEIAGENDVANAKRLFSYFDNEIRYLKDEDKWLLFNGNCWDVAANANTAALYTRAVKLGTILSANAKNANEKKLASAFTKRSKIVPAIDLIKGVERACITQSDLNNHPNLLNTHNGVIDLETTTFYPCRDSSINIQAFYLTQMINAEYRAGYRNEFVLNVLKSIIPEEETRAALFRYLGYCLTGEVTEEKALFLRGGGGNGKGTLSRTLLSLFGSYGTAFPIGALLARRFEADADAATPAIATLLFTRLAICEEIPQGQRLDAAKFKQLTGGDAIYYRQLHAHGHVLQTPSHKFIISGNYDTELQDSHDEGIKRRVIYVPFTQKYSDDNRDCRLKQKLTTPDALAGLLSLLVDNARDWYKDGLLESPEMKSFKRQYFESQDFISSFIEEYCTFKPDGQLYLQDITNKLREYPATPRTLTQTSLREMVKRYFTERPEVTEFKFRNRIAFKGVTFGDGDGNPQQLFEDFASVPCDVDNAIFN